MYQYQWNLYLINNYEDIVVFLSLILYISCDYRNAQVTLVEKPQFKTICFQNYEHGYLIHTWSDKALKGTVVSRALPCLKWGSLEITLTVPLQSLYSLFTFPLQSLYSPFTVPLSCLKVVSKYNHVLFD